MKDIRRFNTTPLLLAFGLLAFGLAALSIADMFVPRPYDGVIPDWEVEDRLVVHEVIAGSGADRAGIRRGDEILGIARNRLRTARNAAEIVGRHRIGEEVIYLIKRSQEVLPEITVELGRRQIGDGTYLYSCLLGLSFFSLGLFVLVRQPLLRASQVFFLLCGFFLLFLVCRMRPASYSGIDTWILGLGTVAFLFLPAAFLHFYLLFPRPAWLQAAANSSWRPLATLWRRAWPVVYLVPPTVFFGALAAARVRGERPHLIYGAPVPSWWLMALFMALGLAVLRANGRLLKDRNERRGIFLVFVGSVLGLAPFMVSSLLFESFQHSGTFFLFGVMPLALVPVTFTYSIVHFQLLDIRVILRRSLLYTVTTALVTGFYALGIVAFNALFSDTKLASSGYFPLIFALAIVLLFEPLRRRVQRLIDRFFFAGQSRLQRAMVELGEAMTAEVDLQEVVEDLVGDLPRLLGLRFSALYLQRGGSLERVAGPSHLPRRLPLIAELQRLLQRRASFTRLDQLGALPLRSKRVAEIIVKLQEAGVEAIGDLASRRRHIGLVLLSAKESRIPLEPDEMTLLQGLMHQAALALETNLLLAERTQRAELERELEIAATIQAQLLPEELSFASGWQVAAECRPARIVGGDFFAQLPAPETGNGAVVYGDVSGKSVSGALMMMAAHEALHALALIQPRPSQLFTLSNRRVYSLGKRSFVALGYFSASADGKRLRYLVAGQPPPLLRRRDGTVSELPLPEHRIPVGALPYGEYETLEFPLQPGDVVLGYSDGVTEARSPEGDFFGDESLVRVVEASAPDPEMLVADVLSAVDEFSRGGLRYDDVTLVAVGRSL